MIFRLVNELQKARAIRYVQEAAIGMLVEIREEKRTEAQNRKMWPMLRDISEQILWDGEYLKPEEWKDLLTAVFKDAKIVAGLYGGFVAVGLSTSRFTKKQFSDFIEFMYSEGAERGVTWSEEARDIYSQYREAQ
jgi:hypothetical protein